MPAIFFFAAEHLFGVLVTSNFWTVPYDRCRLSRYRQLLHGNTFL